MIRHVLHRMHWKSLLRPHPCEHQDDDKIDCKKQRNQPEGHTDPLGEDKEYCESDNDTPEREPIGNRFVGILACAMTCDTENAAKVTSVQDYDRNENPDGSTEALPINIGEPR